MYFTGSQAKNMESTVKGLLKQYLVESLGGEAYASTFAPYGGVDVLLADDGQEAGGRPYVYIRKASCSTKRWGKVLEGTNYLGIWHLWEFEVAALADSFSGAEVGTSNPVASDTLLTDALMVLVNGPEGYQALGALGLEMAKLTAGSETTTALENTASVDTNTLTLSFSTFSLPTVP